MYGQLGVLHRNYAIVHESHDSDVSPGLAPGSFRDSRPVLASALRCIVALTIILFYLKLYASAIGI